MSIDLDDYPEESGLAAQIFDAGLGRCTISSSPEFFNEVRHLSVREFQTRRGYDGLRRNLYDTVLLELPVYVYVFNFYGTRETQNPMTNEDELDIVYDVKPLITVGYFPDEIFDHSIFSFPEDITIDFKKTIISRSLLFPDFESYSPSSWSERTRVNDEMLTLSSERLDILQELIVPQNEFYISTSTLRYGVDDIQVPVELQITVNDFHQLGDEYFVSQEISPLPKDHRLSASIVYGEVSGENPAANPFNSAFLETISNYEIYSSFR